MTAEEWRALGCVAARPPETPKPPKPWWRYAVLRGDGLPAEMNGRWYDLEMMEEAPRVWRNERGVEFVATNKWEQRDDGAVAVVYQLSLGGGWRGHQ